MRWIHKYSVLIAFFLGGLALSGCVHRTEATNTLKFRYWGDTDEVRIIEGMLREFERANPGVKIVSERKSADASYSDQLLQEMAVNAAPDVFFVSSDNFELLSQGNKLENLGPWLAAEKDLKATSYYPTLIQRFTKKGKLLVLPRDIAPVACIYYNRDLFDLAHVKYPKDSWTWDDLRKDAKKLTLRAKDGSVKQFGFADDWNVTDAWILSGGGRQMDDYYHPHRFTFANPGALDGLLFRYSLQQTDHVMPGPADVKALANGTAALFASGQVAMFHSGLWKTPGFRHIDDFQWDVAPFPHKKGVKPLYYCGGSGYGISSSAANPALCWKLVSYLAGPVGQARLAATGLAQPALRKLAKSKVFLDGKNPKNKRMLLKCADQSLSSPAWKPWQEFVRTLWAPRMEEVWVNGYAGDPAAVIKDIQKEANSKYFKKKAAP